MWAGLDGDNDAQLEQAGIVTVCATKNGPPAYGAFSEMLPAQQTIQPTNGTGQLVTPDGNSITPKAGDTINVIVQDVANTVAGTSRQHGRGRGRPGRRGRSGLYPGR